MICNASSGSRARPTEEDGRGAVVACWLRAAARVLLVAAASVAILLMPRPARAQANYQLAPVGGRTTLVGGTGLAFGHDSASAFLNPATVVRVDPGRLAFSVNFYELSFFVAPSWYQPGSINRGQFGDIRSNETSVVSASFESLPSSLCVFLRVGDIAFLAGASKAELRASQARLGLCLATTQSSSFSFDREDYDQPTSTGRTRLSHTVRQTFRRIAVGPSYAMYVSNALVLGASIHLSRAGYQSLFEGTGTTYGTSGRPITSMYFSSARGDSYDVSATVGATYRIGRYQTVALALELPSFHLFGPGGINRMTHYEGAGSATSTLTASGDFVTRTPLRIGLGTGIERRWGSAEVNVSYHIPVGPAYSASLEGRAVDIQNGVTTDRATKLDLSTRARGAVNIGVGGEVYVSPTISLLGGLSTDFSTVSKGALRNDPMNYFQSRNHRFAASFGIGSHGTGGDLLVGGELGYAFGERLAVNSYELPPSLASTDYHNFSLLVVLAGTTSFKVIKRAVNDLTEMVDPTTKKPTTTPKPSVPATTPPSPTPPSPPPWAPPHQ